MNVFGCRSGHIIKIKWDDKGSALMLYPMWLTCVQEKQETRTHGCEAPGRHCEKSVIRGQGARSQKRHLPEGSRTKIVLIFLISDNAMHEYCMRTVSWPPGLPPVSPCPSLSFSISSPLYYCLIYTHVFINTRVIHGVHLIVLMHSVFRAIHTGLGNLPGI